MTARIYGRCQVCGTPVRLPRRTFHALVSGGHGMEAMWLLCRAWQTHPAFNEAEPD